MKQGPLVNRVMRLPVRFDENDVYFFENYVYCFIGVLLRFLNIGSPACWSVGGMDE